MIDINLAPNQLRRKRRKQRSKLSINIPKEALIGLVGGLVVLLIIMHLILFGVTLIKVGQRTKYNGDIEKISSDRDAIQKIKRELRDLQSKKKSIEKVTTEKRVSWSRKLNDISDAIPRGVWLTKISVDQDTVLIEGSAVSKGGQEMIIVGDFTSKLKEQKSFMEGLENIEVGSIQRRNIKTVEVADFLITTKIR